MEGSYNHETIYSVGRRDWSENNGLTLDLENSYSLIHTLFIFHTEMFVITPNWQKFIYICQSETIGSSRISLLSLYNNFVVHTFNNISLIYVTRHINVKENEKANNFANRGAETSYHISLVNCTKSCIKERRTVFQFDQKRYSTSDQLSYMILPNEILSQEIDWNSETSAVWVLFTKYQET